MIMMVVVLVLTFQKSGSDDRLVYWQLSIMILMTHKDTFSLWQITDVAQAVNRDAEIVIQEGRPKCRFDCQGGPLGIEHVYEQPM